MKIISYSNNITVQEVKARSLALAAIVFDLYGEKKWAEADDVQRNAILDRVCVEPKR